jgi:hypothetical protein
VAEADIPREVQKFLREHITSLYQLEILLLLYEKRDAAWTVPDVNRVLQTNESHIESQLEEFHHRGLVDYIEQPEKKYQYRIGSDKTDEIIGAVAQAYKERRLSVTSFIYSTPLDNVRRFADAFRLRKDE